MKQIIYSFFLLVMLPLGNVSANPSYWKFEWPRTDFSKHIVSFHEILSGGPPKDGIPSIDKPQFIKVS